MSQSGQYRGELIVMARGFGEREYLRRGMHGMAEDKHRNRQQILF